MKLSILLSHPGKQHSYQLLSALHNAQFMTKYVTSIWYESNKFPYRLLNLLPANLRKIAISKLEKYYQQDISSLDIIQFPYIALLMMSYCKIRRRSNAEKGIFYLCKIHDKYVSKLIEKEPYDIVIGYELSSLRTFIKAKSHGMVTIMDHAQVHYKYIEYLRNTYHEFRELSLNNHFESRINAFKNQEMKYTDYIICLSNLAKETMTNNGIEANRIYTVSLGFESKHFALKTFNKDKKSFTILYVGTITKRKGLHVLLESFKQLNLQESNLILVGGESDGMDLLEKYKGLYTHIPFVRQDELQKYYQDADVFVLPSILDSWGMVVLESMACGTPVIISENTGAKDIVTDDAGFVIPVNDIKALKERILFLYNNRNKIQDMGKKAYEIAQHYTWKNYKEKIKEIIIDIAKRSNKHKNPH
ncbi:MAG: hypothetical protein A2Y62_11000 [Candidatus Fischerbacteria bacterium RBG_13_37_8]|uniref:Glycosyl transferase family 1 domain-containing protein n=1 Tax=Candidatus Fischerbacteria bacterium RBG_13_37_8 TaxID=1817863 RepID=A0A1F5V7G4_9BACT|nr:MAG: hypothetical protein A2Y62_11000 [Candidatus Fischerbacteria bacterium RBG_13_37_8]